MPIVCHCCEATKPDVFAALLASGSPWARFSLGLDVVFLTDGIDGVTSAEKRVWYCPAHVGEAPPADSVPLGPAPLRSYLPRRATGRTRPLGIRHRARQGRW